MATLRARKVRVKPRREPLPFVTKTVNDVSWKPKTSWLIVLRRENGLKDNRNFKGTYAEAAARRDEYLFSFDSLYASAWLIEQREKSNFATKRQRVESEDT